MNPTSIDIQYRIAQLEEGYKQQTLAMACSLISLIDLRDRYTGGHSQRVAKYVRGIAMQMCLPDDEIEKVVFAASLHDIGKIGVPDEVLRKPGALTPSEYDAIKQHTVLGARILSHVPFLSRHVPIVELHHERPDGNGYPHGLMGDDIPLAARIVHVADAYDAMTNARAYRPGRPSSDALRELWNAAGTEFHAEIVHALATALPAAANETDPALEACVA